jgi:hypothetical protein
LYTPQFTKLYLQSPCQCCGSDRHALLKEKLQKGNEKDLEYCCPIVIHDDIHDKNDGTIKINMLICPYKFAATYEYNRIRVDNALTLLRTKGKGRFMPTNRLASLQSKVYRLCGENHYEKLLDAAEARQDLHAQAPCRCCGSQNHSLLTYQTSLGNRVSVEYSCPFTFCNNWHDARKLTNKNMKYHICPIKLAKYYNYDYNQVKETLRLFVTEGFGKQMNPDLIMAIRHRALKICADESVKGNTKGRQEESNRRELLTCIYTIIACIILSALIHTVLGPKGPQL